MIKREVGQVLIGAIVLLVVLTVMIPTLVYYVQRESTWTVKQQRSTKAFQLAEAGIEKGYQAMILSTTTIANLQSSIPLPNYNFDQPYTDLPGGRYEIKLEGNLAAQTVTITAVGKDTSSNEVRAIRSVYLTPGAYPAAIYAINSATVQGNPVVEWGPVSSPGPIITDVTHTFPRYYSSGLVSPWDVNAGAPPNTDNVQWWSYYPLPPPPAIDLQAYKAAAVPAASCVDNAACLNSGLCTVCYYTATNYPTLSPGTNNHFGVSSPNPATALIVEGNLSLSGNYGNGSIPANTVDIPSTAWKEYGNEWSHYTAMDAYASSHFPTFQDAVDADYVGSGLKYGSVIDKAFIYGFLYIGGTISISGGGNGSIVGSLYCATVANLGNSHVTIYYESAVISQVKVQNGTLARSSWQEARCSWSGPNATCP